MTDWSGPAETDRETGRSRHRRQPPHHRHHPKPSCLSSYQSNCSAVATKQIRLPLRYQTASAISSCHEQTRFCSQPVLLDKRWGTAPGQLATCASVCVCESVEGQINCRCQVVHQLTFHHEDTTGKNESLRMMTCSIARIFK